MDSKEAIEYLNELHGAAASQTEQPSTSEGPEESTGGAPGEQTKNDTPVPPEDAKDDREPPKANEDETTVADEPKTEQKPQQNSLLSPVKSAGSSSAPRCTRGSPGMRRRGDSRG